MIGAHRQIEKSILTGRVAHHLSGHPCQGVHQGYRSAGDAVTGRIQNRPREFHIAGERRKNRRTYKSREQNGKEHPGPGVCLSRTEIHMSPRVLGRTGREELPVNCGGGVTSSPKRGADVSAERRYGRCGKLTHPRHVPAGTHWRATHELCEGSVRRWLDRKGTLKTFPWPRPLPRP